MSVEIAPWATREYGAILRHVSSPVDLTIPALAELGLRRNTRRAHLLVSTVLGKHLPTCPYEIIRAGNLLADLVGDVLTEPPHSAVVLGFAETATGLGHCVAERLRSDYYLHSTRRRGSGAVTWKVFEERHSHATCHLLQPSDPSMLANEETLVLVDDEFSTGETAVDAIRTLHASHRREHYVMASLVDMRTAAHRDAVNRAADEIGARIDCVSLVTGSAELPKGFLEGVGALPEPVLNPRPLRRGRARRVVVPWPATLADGGRFGFTAVDRSRYESAVTAVAESLYDHVCPDHPVIVIGHEELMYLPLRVAERLASAGFEVLYQTTTRSPAYVVDEPGYPLRRGFAFVAPEAGEAAPRYLYNATWPDPARRPQIVAIVDAPADTNRLRGSGGLLDVLTAADMDVILAVLPAVEQKTLRSFREVKP